MSTGLTEWWYGVGVRRVPPRPERPRPDQNPSPGTPQIRVYGAVASPAHWTVPDGARPGWNWLPADGAVPNLRAMPLWVRIWYRLPLIDRFAYEWMWWHGGWAVIDPGDDPPPPDIRVREPIRT